MTPRNPFIIKLPDKQSTLPGRENPIMTPELHYVLGTSIFPEEEEQAVFGLGCFGALNELLQLSVLETHSDLQATPNPTPRSMFRDDKITKWFCIFDPLTISYQNFSKSSGKATQLKECGKTT